MSISAIGSPYLPLDVDPAEASVETAALEFATPEIVAAGAPMVAFAAAAAAATPPLYKEGDPGFELITFSRSSTAASLLGVDAGTVYFMKVGSDLVALKAIRTTDINFERQELNKLQFTPIQVPVDPSDPSQGTQDLTIPLGALPLAGTPAERAAAFLDMHSVDQTALTAVWGTQSTSQGVTYTSLTIPSSPATTAVLLQDGNKIRIVEKLQARDFSGMTLADQIAIAATPAFAAVAATLGLSTDRATALATVEAIRNQILAAFPDNATTVTVPRPGYAHVTITGQKGFMTQEHRQLFLDQLELLTNEITKDLAIFNMTQLADKVNAIKTRFDRALAYGDIPVAGYWESGDPKIDPDATKADFLYQWPQHGYTMGNYPYMLTINGNASVKEGFDEFIKKERIYCEAAKGQYALVRDIKQNNRALDAPMLIMLLQAFDEVIAKANTACTQEELRQASEFLKSCSSASEAISRTLAVAGTKERKYLGRSNAYGDWPADALRPIAMFIKHHGVSTEPQLHPVEKMLGLTSRPTFEIHNASYQVHNHAVSSWQQFANMVNERTNTINQHVQAVNNKINSFQKEENRISDLLSNTRKKILDVLLNAGSKLQ